MALFLVWVSHELLSAVDFFLNIISKASIKRKRLNLFDANRGESQRFRPLLFYDGNGKIVP